MTQTECGLEKLASALTQVDTSPVFEAAEVISRDEDGRALLRLSCCGLLCTARQPGLGVSPDDIGLAVRDRDMYTGDNELICPRAVELVEALRKRGEKFPEAKIEPLEPR